MPQQRLISELDALRVARLRLLRDPESRDLRLEVQLRQRAQIAARRQQPAEPLPALLAGLLRGEISLDTAGQAIARDLSLAGQVASVSQRGSNVTIGAETQMGDFHAGDIAGGNIIKITIYAGAPDER